MTLSQSQKSVVWIVIIVLTFTASAVALMLILREGPGVVGMIGPHKHVTLQDGAAGEDPADDLPIEQFLPSKVLNLDAQDAMARNLALPVSNGPNPVAPAFAAQWLGPELAEATKCLATAVYYEAASEPVAGQRAVAQVVLNRLRNPRYPKTICGVIYQGSERSTGCQFSFACDGSTRRVPGAAGWAVANTVATSVLNGVISAEAGQATHYHTLAVFPAWAPQLAKIGIIGHHVFYRPPGHAAFSYDAIPKVAQGDPLSSADLSMVPSAVETHPPLATVNAEAVATSAIVSRTSTAPLSAQSTATAEALRNAHSSPDTADNQPTTNASPAIKPRRSMFPTRQTRAPNLPLASDR